MTFGIDDSDNRVLPYSGGRARCPRCGEPLIAKCGEIYAWHWAHQVDRDCDPWLEHETEWHRNWKSRFPEDLREVLIVDEFDEKHFADVRTAFGTVIEFQNSSISKATIRTREDFYGEMIWVINAQSFKDNFKLASVVKRKLRQIDAERADPYIPLEDELKSQIKALAESIKLKDEQIEPVFSTLRRSQERQEALVKCQMNPDYFAEQLIQDWHNNNYVGSEKAEVASLVNPIYKERITRLQGEEKALDIKIIALEQKLSQILKLEQIEIEGNSFRIVPWSWITEGNYTLARIFEAKNRNDLFIPFRKFTNNFDYYRVQHNSEKFIACLNLSETEKSITDSIESLKEQLKNLSQFVPSVREDIVSSIKTRIQELIEKVKSRIDDLNGQWETLISERSELEYKKGMCEMRMKSAVPEARKELLRDLDRERVNTMKSYKGYYHFRWKHERKSWEASTAPVYFDIGEPYLLRKVGEDLVQKIEITEFLTTHGSHSKSTVSAFM